MNLSPGIIVQSL